jgi:uncharacterized membrane protein YphA (DoxX/SURF4 family)
MSTNAVGMEAPRNRALWVVQVLGPILFFLAGFAKLSGDDEMIQTFAAIGIRQWFRYVAAPIEFVTCFMTLDMQVRPW